MRIEIKLCSCLILENKEIGQEAKTSEFDDDIKLTPFNMKDELEEGDFDRDGYYHWKKDVRFGKNLYIYIYMLGIIASN